MNKNIEYRRIGRDLTKGKILNLFLIGFIFSVVVSAIVGIGSPFAPTFNEETFEVVNPGNPGLFQLFNLIGVMLGGYVLFGMTKTYIGVTNNEQPIIEDALLAGIKNQPVRAPLLNLIQSLFLGLWTLLFIVPGIIKSYSYALTSYLIVKDRLLSPINAITKSRKLMDGHKFNLFMLDLGYFGWYVLSIFTFGVLLVWVTAWHQTARTLFFNDIVQPETR
jgi:uncharacterized membrane protein